MGNIKLLPIFVTKFNTDFGELISAIKMMKKSNILILISICFLCFSCNHKKTSNNQMKNQEIEYDNLLDIGNSQFIISSSSDISKDKILETDLDLDGEKEKILIGLNHPNGVRVVGFKGKYGTHLLIDGPDGAFDEFGELNKGYYIQASYIDLNHDGKNEVLISVGDKLTGMTTTIYKVRDAEEDSFKLIGTIEGQSKMYLEGNHIIAPIGFQGLFKEYIYDGQRLFEATD